MEKKYSSIIYRDGKPEVPFDVTIPYIEGDGTGADIWNASRPVFDAAVQKVYNGSRGVEWKEIFAGEKAFDRFGKWLPEQTEEAIKEHIVAIKGPLTTPVGGGMRSLNVTLRQHLDLFVCLRPVRYYSGVPSPVKNPQLVDMVIFRENTEDVYAGLEVEGGTAKAEKLRGLLEKEMGWTLRSGSGIGIKPASPYASKRLVRAAVQYAVDHNRKSVTLVHKGNIAKYTEGAFRNWGYELAAGEFGDKTVSWDECGGRPPEGKILIKDCIADAFLQQILTRPAEFDVIATGNLNGDYISDALAAQVGGIGIAPGANINYENGIAVFEATHGTAPKYAGLDKVNPGSVILSGVMLFRYIGWGEAADLIEKGLTAAIGSGHVTYDFARLTDGAVEVGCRRFGEKIIEGMD